MTAGAVARRTGKPKDLFVALGFLVPSLIGFFLFFAYPAVRGLALSFTDWDLLSEPQFIGFDNYLALFEDSAYWNSLWVTIQYVLWNIPAQTLLALAIAMMMNKLTKTGLLKGAFLVPWLIPNVIVAMLWLWLLDPAVGLLDEVVKAMGFPPQGFLANADTAMPLVAWINIWKWMGYNALILYAGLQGIPKEINEAAVIDGANGWKEFTRITLPMLRPVLAFILVTTVIGSFQIYDTVAITTKGGPVDATWVMNFYLFKYAFQQYHMGYATAGSMVLFALLFVVGLVQMRMMRAGEAD
jgi:multiple sugar transport system permease protein